VVRDPLQNATVGLPYFKTLSNILNGHILSAALCIVQDITGILFYTTRKVETVNQIT